MLAEDGTIAWQKDLTNPMPGEPVAIVKKGTALLSPDCTLIDASPALEGQDKDVVLKFVQDWLGRYIKTALEPLFNLQADDIADGAAKEIAQKLNEAMGILPRAELQNLIGQMDDDARATLRSKKIRFGPLLVFLPELNKPAAVRLRALLLTLWNDKTLPAEVPADGIVSFSVADKEVDHDYYRAIGYPIYGPRSIRVDMLDRVICEVYDSAKDGKFMAQHKMAEWLGSNIQDLYAVLEAMGHTKESEPVAVEKKSAEEAPVKGVTEDAVKDTTEDDPADEAKPVEVTADAPASEDKEIVSIVIEPKKEPVKPELATFRLKRGKAIDSKSSGSGNANRNSSKKWSSSDKPKFKSKNHKGKKAPRKEPRERVYIAEAKSNPEDSPFAILQQLQMGNKDK